MVILKPHKPGKAALNLNKRVVNPPPEAEGSFTDFPLLSFHCTTTANKFHRVSFFYNKSEKKIWGIPQKEQKPQYFKGLNKACH